MIKKHWTPLLIYTIIMLGLGGFAGTLITKSIIEDNRRVVKEVIREDSNLSEWELLIMAFIKTESDFNQYARSSKDALGILQETEVFVKEVNRLLGEEKFVHSDAYDPMKSIEMFYLYQAFKNPSRDQDKAIYLHNPGGKSINYSGTVYKHLAEIKKYEEIRKTLINYTKGIHEPVDNEK